MKILFIEADETLDNDQEKFAQGLENEGHKVIIITDCYDQDALKLLRSVLIKEKPEVIFVQTTFTLEEYFKVFIPFYGLIDYPVELWYTGVFSASRLIQHIPQQYRHNFTGYDIWLHAYFMHRDSTDEIFMWKRPIKQN